MRVCEYAGVRCVRVGMRVGVGVRERSAARKVERFVGLRARLLVVQLGLHPARAVVVVVIAAARVRRGEGGA